MAVRAFHTSSENLDENVQIDSIHNQDLPQMEGWWFCNGDDTEINNDALMHNTRHHLQLYLMQATTQTVCCSVESHISHQD